MPAASRPSPRTLAALGLLLAVAGVIVMHAGRGTMWFYDEWNFVVGRRGFTADSFLRDHNGHLSLVPVAAYKVLLQLFGLHHYWVWRVVLLALNLANAVLAFTLVRRRGGDVAGLCAAILIAFLGSSWDDLLWGFQIGFQASLTAGMVMLLALQRRSGRADLLAAVALGVSLASSSLGIPIAIACVVELGVAREWRRLMRVALVPLALYGLWRLGYATTSDLQLKNIDAAPAYVFQMLAAATGGLSGLGISAAGPSLAVAAIIAFAFALGGRSDASPRLLALVAAVLAFCTLTALARAQNAEPQAPRYIYPTALLLVLAASEALPARRLLSGRAAVVAISLAVIAAIGNLQVLNQGAGSLRADASQLKAELGAFELSGQVNPQFVPSLRLAPAMSARQYTPAARDFGSPADSPAQLARASETDREAADAVFIRAEQPTVSAVGPATRGTACRTLQPGASVAARPGSKTLVVAARGDSPAVTLLRFADSAPQPFGRLQPGLPSLVVIPGDRLSRPWHIQVSGARPVRVCAG